MDNNTLSKTIGDFEQEISQIEAHLRQGSDSATSTPRTMAMRQDRDSGIGSAQRSAQLQDNQKSSHPIDQRGSPDWRGARPKVRSTDKDTHNPNDGLNSFDNVTQRRSRTNTRPAGPTTTSGDSSSTQDDRRRKVDIKPANL